MIPSHVIKSALDRSSGEIVINQQIRCNHEGCPAGEDKRQRLYIKRLTSVKFVAYCHNCGEPGYFRLGSTLSEKLEDRDVFAELADLLGQTEETEVETHQVEEDEVAVATLPADATQDWSCFPAWATEWLSTRMVNCTRHMEELQWWYSPWRDSIIMPIKYDPDADAINMGYQERFKPGAMPKTLTTYAAGCPRIGYAGWRKSWPCFKDVETLVLVEDPLSASLVSYSSEYMFGYALLGTHLSDAKKVHLIDIMAYFPELKRVVVWMDDDLAGYAARIDIATAVQALTPNTICTRIVDDGTPAPNKIGGTNKIRDKIEKLVKAEK